jgi:hypothetical protein
VKLPPVTVRAIVVVAVRVPDVPVIVTIEVPAATVAGAVSVSTLVDVVGLGANTAVHPAGRPDAARVTAPVNPPVSVTVMVSVPLAPGASTRLVGEAESVKPGGGATVRLIGTAAVSVPLVPVIVTDDWPRVAVAEAVNVSFELGPVVDVGAKLAVTPDGRPLAVNATAPVKPPAGVIVTVLVPLPP